MTRKTASVAVRRLGLGAMPGELNLADDDPQAYVLAQLDADPALQSGQKRGTLRATASLLVADEQFEKRFRGQRARLTREQNMDQNPGMLMRGGRKRLRPGVERQKVLRREVAARIAHAAETEAPFLERLVMFWSNHFCVSAGKGRVRRLAGAYEREVIRPHVLGRFSDMLKASAQHPAMLIYLDNFSSIGPSSPFAASPHARRKHGLNENLAREILELHTVGVNGGYSQEDVRNFARILTGWTVGKIRQGKRVAGRFMFMNRRHEPGVWEVMGQGYDRPGKAAGEDVLTTLARHPATARFLAQKLAAHFVSDTPPPALVARLTRSFRKSDGDLRALAQTLATSPEVWSAPAEKFIPPYDFGIGLMRGFGWQPNTRAFMRLTKSLGQPVWQVPSPKGWPQGNNVWAAPAALRERLRAAGSVAGVAQNQIPDVSGLAADLVGAEMSDDLRVAVRRAESKTQALTLLMMSPEFQRR